MQPAALVLPARESITAQSVSASILSYISAAMAKSRDVNDIFLMASMMAVALKDFMSMCSMGVFRKSFLFMNSSVNSSLAPVLVNAGQNVNAVLNISLISVNVLLNLQRLYSREWNHLHGVTDNGARA